MNIGAVCLITLLSTPEGNMCIFSYKMLNYVYRQVAGLLSGAEQRVHSGFISLEKTNSLRILIRGALKSKDRPTLYGKK